MKISDKLLKSVAFIGIKEGGKFRPRATCFFVNYEQDQHFFPHLVTAEHVISGLMARGHDIWLRVNLQNGEGGEALFDDPSAFRFHPNERERTDVAICPFDPHGFTDDESGKNFLPDFMTIKLEKSEDGFLATDEFKKETIGLGAQIIAVGLFRSHYGRDRNTPIVRVGNIAAMPGEPVYTEYAGYLSAYLVEARSIAGLSGSPVFVLPGVASVLTQAFNRKSAQGAALLGLMHGHFDVKNLNEDVVADDSDPQRSIHTGIGVVIPVEKIVETLNHPDLVSMRQKVVERIRQSGVGAVPDTISTEAEASLPANGENPTHREDFMRLVDVAGRKPEPKD